MDPVHDAADAAWHFSVTAAILKRAVGLAAQHLR
jgi:hypothetical protein